MYSYTQRQSLLDLASEKLAHGLVDLLDVLHGLFHLNARVIANLLGHVNVVERFVDQVDGLLGEGA